MQKALMQISKRSRPRQPRSWLVDSSELQNLGRTARQLARISASRIAQPQVAECLRKLKIALEFERVCKLVIGDLLVELVDGHGLRAIDIARETGYRQADLSEMLKTARLYPAKSRPVGVGYNQFLMASRMVSRFPELKFTKRRALKEVVDSRLSQHRDVTRHFAQLARQIEHQQTDLAPACRKLAAFCNRAYHSRFQDLLPRFPDRSIAILHIDPPYLFDNGKPYRSRSARSQVSDSADPETAIDLVLDVLRQWQRKMTKNGVVLLWQPWGSLHSDIDEAIDEYQWNHWGPIVWDKQRAQPGDFVTPYSVQGEMLWMIFRAGDKPRNYDGGGRESILRYRPVSFPGSSHTQVHAFEKPLPLMEHLLLKHSRRCDLVFDACGCTGGMSVAAITNGRRWVYAESNRANFEIGEENINRAVPARRRR
jgi:DNA modification methylase